MSIVGRTVTRAGNAAPHPVTGVVTGRLDDGRVEVEWGDISGIVEERLEDLSVAS